MYSQFTPEVEVCDRVMRSVQPRARQLLQIEFSGKDASPDEVPGPGMALAVGEDCMGMHKWLAVEKRDVAGT